MGDARPLPWVAPFRGGAGRARFVELVFSPARLAPRAVAVAHPFPDVLQVRGADLPAVPRGSDGSARA